MERRGSNWVLEYNCSVDYKLKRYLNMEIFSVILIILFVVGITINFWTDFLVVLFNKKFWEDLISFLFKRKN